MQKQPMIQESFRLTPENSEKLEQLKQTTGENKNSLINKMIAEYKVK
jgi:predicted DNA-binding protein